MTDEEKRELYEKSKLRAGNVKIAATNPGIKNKIRTNIAEDADTVFWYIRFNTGLDASSVSKKTMNVTERNGYIVNTDISYVSESRVISICPIDCYAQNEYYFLNISKKVKSDKGVNLKREIHIMFKIVGNQIAEFKILSPETKLPKSKKRPPGYLPNGELVFPVNPLNKVYTSTFKKEKFDRLPQDKLPYETLKFNPIIAIIGLIVAGVGIYLRNYGLVLAAAVIAAAGFAHIIVQFTRKEKRATIRYNAGAFQFNRGRYKKARESFKQAAAFDERNEYAEYAAAKVKFYV